MKLTRELVDNLRAAHRRQWLAGNRVPVEEYLAKHPTLESEDEWVIDLVYSEILLREEQGEVVSYEEYLARFPQHAAGLRRQLALHELLRSGRQAEEAPGASEISPGPVPDLPGYEILGLLGKGARGVVYRARQVSLGRCVAMKFLRDEDMAGPEERALFRREAAIVAGLRHPNIAQVYDFGEHAGRLFLVMELVEGGTLVDRIANSPFEPAAAAVLIETLARTLDAVHRQGLVHRDIKPGNVLLSPDGTPKLVDFGLAKRLRTSGSLIESHAIVGTFGYMAPEQVAGHRAEVGPAADIYALGILLYEAVVGRHPYQGAGWREVLRLMDGPDPVTLPKAAAPKDLRTIVATCLRRNPSERYISAAALADDLRRFFTGERVLARPLGWLDRAWSIGRGRALQRVCVGISFLIAGAVVPLLVVPRQERPAQGMDSGMDVEGIRREAETVLGEGRPYVFSGSEFHPGPFRWVVGEMAPPRPNPDGACLSVETLTTGLLELVADPQCEHYRFSAELRHDRQGGTSRIGLYFGYQELPPLRSLRRAGFFTFSSADRGSLVRKSPEQRATSPLALRCDLFKDRPGAPYFPGTPVFTKSVRAEWPLDRPSPWRKFVVGVNQNRVQVTWSDAGQTDSFEQSVPLTLLERRMKDLVNANEEFSDFARAFNPRGGLGIYVQEAGVSLRRVRLEPLTGEFTTAPKEE